MRLPASALLVVVLLAAPAAFGETVTHATRRVTGPAAVPLPFLLDDAEAWRVVVPAGQVVCVDARAQGASAFTLSWSGPQAGGSPVPGLRAGAILGEGAWTVTIDPVAGAPVDVVVEFRGAFVDCVNQHAAPFEIEDLPGRAGCGLPPGACLP